MKTLKEIILSKISDITDISVAVDGTNYNSIDELDFLYEGDIVEGVIKTPETTYEISEVFGMISIVKRCADE